MKKGNKDARDKGIK